LEVWSWKEDEVEIAISEEGERRYVGWEVIGEILGGIVKSHELKAAEDVKWKWDTDDGIFRLTGPRDLCGDVAT
jgi:hypothetical protein